MLTLVMPYYDNHDMLALHYRTWKSWPVRLRNWVAVVIVDDGSSTHPAANVPRPYGLPAISIYRVAEDRPWHQHGARNLGAHVAEGPWLLLTDMDHVLTADNAAILYKRLPRLDPATAYMLHRIEADTGFSTMGKDDRLKPHPNSFVMTRDLYWKVGGYDEDYCGIYGTDGLFRARLSKLGFLEHVALTRYWRDIVPDASTTTLLRKEGRKPGDKDAVAVAKAARGEADVVKVLQFDWERVL